MFNLIKEQELGEIFLFCFGRLLYNRQNLPNRTVNSTFYCRQNVFQMLNLYIHIYLSGINTNDLEQIFHVKAWQSVKSCVSHT